MPRDTGSREYSTKPQGCAAIENILREQHSGATCANKAAMEGKGEDKKEKKENLPLTTHVFKPTAISVVSFL